MERKEPTLFGGEDNSREETSGRRPTHVHDDSRSARALYMPGSKPSAVPAIALVIALIGVAGAGFLGWKFLEAQKALVSADTRITQLENQLNVTSNESTASVGSLQVNLKAVDSEVKKLWDLARKIASDNAEKLSGVYKNIDGAKKEIGDLKVDNNSIKQEALSAKLSAEEMVARLEAQEKALVEQSKKLKDTSASLSAMVSQVKSAEGLAARIKNTEEAIEAIDDNRRSINRDLVQIKQQLGIKN
jgi:chromosome segregation ATPase